LAIDCLHRSNPFKAENYLLRVAESDSYFRAVARAELDVVREQMVKIRQKIPALVNDLKQGDVKPREEAAFKLLYECGSEGVQALQAAQEDSDKYVRYMATCTLAAQFVDRSVKPRFDIILEACTDNDPNVRRKAISAVDFRTCVEMDSAKTVTLVRLMREHYSEELAFGLDDILFSAPTDTLEVAVPELIALREHKNGEASDRVADLLDRIAYSLSQQLEIEDEPTQVKIVGILKRMAPVAPQVVPFLTWCAQHNNANVRNAANDALKDMPRTADQQPEGTRDP
jgi:HEAT repeat protein